MAELADDPRDAEALPPHVFRTARLAYDAMRAPQGIPNPQPSDAAHQRPREPGGVQARSLLMPRTSALAARSNPRKDG